MELCRTLSRIIAIRWLKFYTFGGSSTQQIHQDGNLTQARPHIIEHICARELRFLHQLENDSRRSRLIRHHLRFSRFGLSRNRRDAQQSIDKHIEAVIAYLIWWSASA